MESSTGGSLPVLGSAEALEPAAVGGKAASLCRLTRLGLEVPSGFVVPTTAYRQALEAEGLREWIADALAPLDPADLGELGRVGARIRRRITGVPLPGALEEALRGGWEALAREQEEPLRVAVRSSATLEDLPEASFAGQHESFLGVRDPEEVLRALRACWASLYTDRALAYRHRMGLGDEEVLAAVIVQRMVDTEVSGVLFTVDPTTGSPDRLRVEATWGLGEGLVSGRVDPDTYHLDPRTGALLSQRIGAKATQVVGGPAGTRERETPAALRSVPCLGEEALAALAAAARRAVVAFGGPLDIEWGLRRGRPCFLQARPVTTRPAVPPTSEGTVRVLAHANFAETMPDPPSPLGWSLFAEHIEDALLPPPGARLTHPDYRLAVLAYGRPFWDFTPLLWFDRLWDLLRDTLVRVTDGPTARACDRLRARHPFRFPLRRLLWPGTWWRASRFFLAWLPLHLAGLARIWIAPRAALERVDAAHRELLAEASCRPPRTAPPTLQAREVGAALDRLHRLHRDAVVPPFLAAMACAGQVLLLCWAWLGERGSTELGFKLAAGRSGNHTLAMGLHLWALSRAARRDPAVRRILEEEEPGAAYARLAREHGTSRFMIELRAFLGRYGHRGAGEQDLETPRWAEAPETLLPLLRGAVRIEEGERSPPARRARALEEYRTLRASCEARLGGSRLLPRLRLAVFRWFLDRSEQLFPMREDLKHLLFLGSLGLRRRLLALGRALAREGHLRRPEDIWYLEKEELLEWVEAGCPEPRRIRSRILRRRLERERHRSLRPPLVVTSAGDEVHPEAEADLDAEGRLVLRGEPGSRGRVQGRARVLTDPRDGHLLEPGEVLVAPFTDPGWTPLFLVAAGLVMDVGGTISHGVIAAREYGIPAVVGLGDATRRIRDGQLLTLDGARGTVRLEDEDAEEALASPAPRPAPPAAARERRRGPARGGSRSRRTGGFSLLELLLTVAIVAALVGIAVPFFQGHLREAQEARVRAQFAVVKGQVSRLLVDEGLTGSQVPDSPFTVPWSRFPASYPTIEQLVPRYLHEVPRDPWGNPLYLFGNYVVSNGPEGVPEQASVIAEPLAHIGPTRNPDTGELWVTGEFQEALDQSEWLARLVWDYMRSHPPPANLEEVFHHHGRSLPLDPWGRPYGLREQSDGDLETYSPGPDGVEGNTDDADTTVDFPLGTTEVRFSKMEHMANIAKLYPGEPERSIPCRWDEAEDALVYSRRRAATPGRMAFWVRVPHTRIRDVPQFRVTATFDVTRIQGAVQVGVFGNYTGRGTGYRAQVLLGESSALLLGWGAPHLQGTSPLGATRTAPASPRAAPMSGQVVLRLEADVGDDTVDIEAQVTGMVSTPELEVTLPRARLHEKGLVGWFVAAPSPASEFDVALREVVYSRPAS